MVPGLAATTHSMPNHGAPPLSISEPERATLLGLARGTTEQHLAKRARIVLRASEGLANSRIADAVGVSPMTVLLLRGRFARVASPVGAAVTVALLELRLVVVFLQPSHRFCDGGQR
jgi:hypothetical protein